MDNEYKIIIDEISILLKYNIEERDQLKERIEICLKSEYITSEILRGVLSETLPFFFVIFADMLQINPSQLNERFKVIKGFETELYLKKSLKYYASQYKVR